jgi:predicted ATP-grasp superfamily ATP-dependent carboligase
LVWPIEINPRYTAGMEVLERSTGCWAFGTGEAPPENRRRFQGKAYVFATRALAAGDLSRALGPQRVADIPEPGEPLPRGAPICTVLAWGDDEGAVMRELRDLAGRVYTACEA